MNLKNKLIKQFIKKLLFNFGKKNKLEEITSDVT